jgi:uncharacterized protein
METLQDKLNSQLELTILPTEKCNFRCVYCYEDFAIGKMKPPVVDGIKALVRRRIQDHGLRRLRVEWFGGEPLLAKQVVLDLSREFYEHFESGGLADLECSMTTNGYILTPDLLHQLVGYKLNFYQISLDGDEERHNATRRYASGKGTFETIYANLLAAHESDLSFTIMLRLHIMPGNEASIHQLADRLIRDFSGDARFTIFLRDISNLGGAGGSLEIIEHKDAVRISKDLQSRLSEAGFKVENGVESQFESQITVSGLSENNAAYKALENNPLRVQHVCYAAKPNQLLIRADGRLGKCTVALSSERNVVGRIETDGRVKLDADRMQFWTRGFLSGDPVELGCPLIH